MRVHIGGRTIAGADRGQITHGQSAALMIEEGHDFQPEWFKLVMQMVGRPSRTFAAGAVRRRPGD
jgi:hypothetical protein